MILLSRPLYRLWVSLSFGHKPGLSLLFRDIDRIKLLEMPPVVAFWVNDYLNCSQVLIVVCRLDLQSLTFLNLLLEVVLAQDILLRLIGVLVEALINIPPVWYLADRMLDCSVALGTDRVANNLTDLGIYSTSLHVIKWPWLVQSSILKIWVLLFFQNFLHTVNIKSNSSLFKALAAKLVDLNSQLLGWLPQAFHIWLYIKMIWRQPDSNRQLLTCKASGLPIDDMPPWLWNIEYIYIKARAGFEPT